LTVSAPQITPIVNVVRPRKGSIVRTRQSPPTSRNGRFRHNSVAVRRYPLGGEDFGFADVVGLADDAFGFNALDQPGGAVARGPEPDGDVPGAPASPAPRRD